MAFQYSDLLTQLIGEVGDVTPLQLEIVFRRCLTSFMEKSQAWRTRFNTDLAAATPDPATRESLITAYEVAQAATSASPNDLTLAQAAADAHAAAYAPPLFTLTRPVQTPAVVGPPAVAAVYYTAIATGMRVEHCHRNLDPWWRINPATAAGGNQTLEILSPVSHQSIGGITARLFWTPIFDSDPALAVPTWVYERYGGIISDWTIGTLWMRRRGNRSDQRLGQEISNNAMLDAERVRARANREDPLPMSV